VLEALAEIVKNPIVTFLAGLAVTGVPLWNRRKVDSAPGQFACADSVSQADSRGS
jgi:hypothetical protein